MDLDSLRALIAVVETGSFAGAAKSLRAARATLKRRIDDLEARTGVALVRSSREGAVPTTAGKLLAQKGRAILSEAQSVVEAVRDVDRHESTVARLVMPVGPPPQAVPIALDLTAAAFPNVTWDIVFSDDPLSESHEGVSCVVHIGPKAPKGSWKSTRVGSIEQVLLATRSYLDTKGEPRQLADLDEHRLAVWRAPGCDPFELPLLSGGVHRVRPTLVTADIHLLRTLASARKDIAFVPYMPFALGIYDSESCVRLLDDVVGRTVGIWMLAPEPATGSSVDRVLQAIVGIAARFLVLDREASGEPVAKE